MKRVIALVASVAALLPAAVRAQAHEHADAARVVAPVEQTQTQTQAERRAQERARLQQERDRARARQRADQMRREYPEQQSEKVSRTLKIGGSGELDLSNLAGDITITRGSGNAVQIEAVKVARARTADEAREMLKFVTIDIVERGTRAEVKSLHARHEERAQTRWNFNVSVTYTVSAPENTRIAARSLSGDITVTDIKGDLNLVSTSGDVTVTNAARLMSAKSTSGKVEIVNLQSQIALEAGTVAGDLVIRQSRASRMDLGTVSGNLMINAVDCGRIEAQSLSGDIEFSSPLEKSGRYELNSHSGTILVVPTGNTGFELDVNSFNGNIQANLTLKDQRQGGADSDRRGRGLRMRSLRGVYGDGSAMVDITTFSGTVTIGKK